MSACMSKELVHIAVDTALTSTILPVTYFFVGFKEEEV
jgi:hypothetical protein